MNGFLKRRQPAAMRVSNAHCGIVLVWHWYILQRVHVMGTGIGMVWYGMVPGLVLQHVTSLS